MDITALPKLQCPHCGHTRRFYINITARASIENQGAYDFHNIAVDLDAACTCSCGHIGSVADFRDYAATNVPVVSHDAVRRLSNA